MNVHMSLDTIALEHVTHRVGSAIILRDVSVRCTRGMWYSLHGVSGSGKSTLLHILAGFFPPSEGEVAYNDRSIKTYTCDALQYIRYAGLGIIFQEPFLIHELSVVDNIMLKGHIAGIASDVCYAMATELLASFGLLDYAARMPVTLSGGEQQRVAIMRGLLGNPHFLLIDEPTAHLDTQAKRQMMVLLQRLRDQYALGMIVATHDPEVAQYADETWELCDGTLVCASR